MPNNQEVKSNRDRYAARLKEKYPDKEFADDEALFGQINDDYDNYDKELSEYKDRESALSNLFTSNPRSAAFFTTMREGGDPIVAYVRQFGPEFTEALKDPEKQEALAEANKEYAERIADEKKYEEEYKKNISETLKTLEAFQNKNNLTDEQVDECMAFLIGVMKDAILGKFSEESMLMALKAINHDQDVEEADHEGEVRGKNTRISEKLRKRGKGDGTAHLAGKNGGSAQREMPDLGAIDKGFGTSDIFERGGEKRRSYK